MSTLIKVARFLFALVVAGVVGVLLSAAASGAFSSAYRTYKNLPGNTNLVENPEWVMWNLLIALPVLIVAFIFTRRRLWRWSARFQPKLESDPN